jgi:integrase
MRVNLTPAFIAKATVPDGKDREIYWDTRVRNFGLVVTKAGHKSYCVQYRHRGTSKRPTIDGVLSLEQARKRAKVLLGQVAHGGDPLGEERKQRDAERNTLRAISEQYFARKGKHLRSANELCRNLERAVFPTLGSHPIADIRRSDIVRLLDKLEDERGEAAAQTSFAILRGIMSWHSTRTDDFRSPIVRGMSRYNSMEHARERILDDSELRRVWIAAGEMGGPFGALVRFLLLTAARRNEAARMTHDELDGTIWTLPAARNKVKADLARPLSGAAQAVLAALPRFHNSPYVFTVSGRTALGNFAKAKVRLDQLSGTSGWQLHDLRRTARSLMSRAGIPSDHAERCLGHAVGGIRGVYDRHRYQAEMLHAFEALAALLDQITNPQQNVMHMARK